jgi:hypothetical protein
MLSGRNASVVVRKSFGSASFVVGGLFVVKVYL